MWYVITVQFDIERTGCDAAYDQNMVISRQGAMITFARESRVRSLLLPLPFSPSV